MAENPWNKLSGIFDTHKDNPSEIHPDAADNILIVWPALLEAIRNVQPKAEKLKALDFGCGTGGFCAKLKDIGYDIVGCDGAENMVALARRSLQQIPFYVADERNLITIDQRPFDLVTAIMVFQFIQDIAAAIRNIGDILKSNGMMVFAVFNPEYVKKNRGEGRSFQGFTESESLGEGYFCPKSNLKIPVFIRNESDYDRILEPMGFHRLTTTKPPFTHEFLARYPLPGTDISHSQYLVMTYKKQ